MRRRPGLPLLQKWGEGSRGLWGRLAAPQRARSPPPQTECRPVWKGRQAVLPESGPTRPPSFLRSRAKQAAALLSTSTFPVFVLFFLLIPRKSSPYRGPARQPAESPREALRGARSCFQSQHTFLSLCGSEDAGPRLEKRVTGCSRLLGGCHGTGPGDSGIRPPATPPSVGGSGPFTRQFAQLKDSGFQRADRGFLPVPKPWLSRLSFKKEGDPKSNENVPKQ